MIVAQRRLIERMPADLRPLAEFCWTELRSYLDAAIRKQDVDPIASAKIAARVSRLVCTEIYTDLKIYRLAPRFRK